MGAHLTSILSVWGGVNIVVTSRKERESEKNIKYIRGNAHDLTFLQQVLKTKDWDAIIDFMSYKTDEFRQRYELLLNSTNQYIFLSSARVYADSREPLTEDSPRLLDVCDDQDYLATDEYALTKARQEDLLIKSGKVNWTIVRPYITFSESRLQLSAAEKEYWLWGALAGKSILYSRDLAAKYTTLTYGYDVARGIASLISKGEAMGQAFNITTSESHLWSEVLENYLDVLEQKIGRRPQVKMVDTWNPLMSGGVDQIKKDRLYNRRFDNTRISKFIDTGTFKQTLPAMAECLAIFIEKQDFKEISWSNEARKDRLLGERTSIRKIKGLKQKIKYLLIRQGLHR